MRRHPQLPQSDRDTSFIPRNLSNNRDDFGEKTAGVSSNVRLYCLVLGLGFPVFDDLGVVGGVVVGGFG